MNQQLPGGSVRREGIWVGHRDLGRLPLLGRQDSISVVGQTVARDGQTGGHACASCGRVMVQPDQFFAVCVCCGLPICTRQECQVFCEEETCRQAVCAPDRRRIGEDEAFRPQYLCLPHYHQWERERMLIGFLILAAAAAMSLVIFFWLR